MYNSSFISYSQGGIDKRGHFIINKIYSKAISVADEIRVMLSGRKIVFSIPETLSNGRYSLDVKRVFGGEMREEWLNKTIQVGTINPNCYTIRLTVFWCCPGNFRD